MSGRQGIDPPASFAKPSCAIRLDARDFELIAALRREPLASFERLGAQLRISGNSARLRYEALIREGVMTPIEALVNGEAIGRSTVTTWVKNVDSPAKLQRAFDHPDAYLVIYYPDRDAMIWTCSMPASADDLPSQFLGLGFEVTRSVPAPWRPLPRTVEEPLSDMDLKMLEALVPNPRRPIRALAAELGCAPRTAVALRDSLVRRGVVEFAPLIRLGWSKGIFLYRLLLTGDPDVCSSIVAARPHLMKYWPSYRPPGCILIGYAASAAEAYREAREIADVPGIAAAQIAYNADLVYHRERVKDLISAFIEERRTVGSKFRASEPSVRQ